jgi:hypothetical protein
MIFLFKNLLSQRKFVALIYNADNLDGMQNLFVCSKVPMLCVTIGSFAVSILGITMMYVWFAPHATCSINIFMITWTLIQIQVITSISLHSKVFWFSQSRLFRMHSYVQYETSKRIHFWFDSGECGAVNLWVDGLVYNFSRLVCTSKVYANCNFFFS